LLAEAKERDEHRGLLPYGKTESLFRYAVRPKKQFSVEYIVQDSKTRRQHSGFKNNDRKGGTGSVLAHENYGRPSYGGL